MLWFLTCSFILSSWGKYGPFGGTLGKWPPSGPRQAPCRLRGAASSHVAGWGRPCWDMPPRLGPRLHHAFLPSCATSSIKKKKLIIFDDCTGIKMDIMQAAFIITQSSLLIFMVVIEVKFKRNEF